MANDLPIPPITKNPRLGQETERDASVMYGGAQLPKSAKRSTRKRPAQRRRQHSLTINNEEAWCQLSKTLGISKAAVVNLGIAKLAKEYL